MTAPNIVAVQTISGKTSILSLTTTNATVLLANLLNSNSVYKINSIVVANINGVNAANFSLAFNTAQDGSGTSNYLVSTVSVPANAALIALDKSTSIYLEEGKSLVVTAGTANILQVTISYEIIS